jgi:hypothetical protein
VRLDDCPDVVSREQVMEIFQFRGLSTLYDAVNAGRFPPPDLTYPARWFRPRLMLWWTDGVRVKPSKLRRVS